MDINKIRKLFVDTGNMKLLGGVEFPDHMIERNLLEIISDDDNAMDTIMEMVSVRRNRDRVLIKDLNHLVSLSEVVLSDPKKFRGTEIQPKIIDFFTTHKNTRGIGHCYKRHIQKRKNKDSDDHN